ncbi:hypothetical protein G7047_11510 [Diaphorobacter sp. HDW4A]|uniref:hypothetical protein n=1 Tax=Diaphorobacter sp. HDW4A TaxID=2714924 RepID=UPI00140D845C|nr:hypothetical protein [Diaphorobacter sp. HDW4A]QIL80458.1 hypothetical protein G7047_11510 [Diaphorobacter sp. HDW4A]
MQYAIQCKRCIAALMLCGVLEEAMAQKAAQLPSAEPVAVTSGANEARTKNDVRLGPPALSSDQPAEAAAPQHPAAVAQASRTAVDPKSLPSAQAGQ